MIGTTDDRLLIDRVGGDAEGVVGFRPVELLGQSLLGLVDHTHVPQMLGALAQAFTTTNGVATATVAIRTKNGHQRRCEAIVVPLVPAPTSAFAFFREEPDAATSLTDVQRLLQRFRDRLAAIDFSRDLATALTASGIAPDLTALTAREREIVQRLVGGDRVPAIAEALFLSQNTIRNQLSAAYRKLGVQSQQELIDLFRSGGGGRGSA
jgi:DNA-binding CsgD family transcriptional regulator